ncbi:MAG: FAD-dependent monooxygenase [Actinomycetota bacterium]|nr:FAD-dependent monooxygenase [Actinomycetota bacterium]
MPVGPNRIGLLALDHDTTALIVGGGIAGLTASIALHHHGIDSLVFEQADDLGMVQGGSGVALGYNASRAFRHLGVLDELAAVAAPIERFRFLTAKGKLLGSAHAMKDELALGIRRPVFHKFLVDAAGSGRMRLGAKLVRFEQDDATVTAHFADGRSARGDFLIGADGLRSTVRAQLLGDSEPRYAGYCGRQGVVETETAREALMITVLGRGECWRSYPVGRRWIYWTAGTNQPPGGKERGAEIKQKVLERFRGFPEPVEALVEATDESNTFFADTYDRDPVKRWGEGRVTLLGDAAHPMTWNRGQGAGQGIEGAVLLAGALAQSDDPVTTLREWEAERIPRTAKVVRAARRNGQVELAEKLPARLLRNGALRIMISDVGFERQNKDLLVEY